MFFDRYGRMVEEEAGFDAVVGNPPYVRQEGLSPLKPWFAQAFPRCTAARPISIVYFIGQGLRQLREGHRLAYIASNSWLRANYAVPLRHHLRTAASVDQVIDLGDNRVFADAPSVPDHRRGP